MLNFCFKLFLPGLTSINTLTTLALKVTNIFVYLYIVNHASDSMTCKNLKCHLRTRFLSFSARGPSPSTPAFPPGGTGPSPPGPRGPSPGQAGMERWHEEQMIRPQHPGQLRPGETFGWVWYAVNSLMLVRDLFSEIPSLPSLKNHL